MFKDKKHAGDTASKQRDAERPVEGNAGTADEGENITPAGTSDMGAMEREDTPTGADERGEGTGNADVKDMERKAEEYRDNWLRTAAEFENFKKRQEKQQTEFYKRAVEALARDLLPIVDSLERALSHGKESNVPQSFIDGIELSRKSFMDVLEKHGVKPIPAEGEKFDPNFHEAMMQQENPDVEENTVLTEAQKGYLLNDRLLRPSLVVVSKKPAQDD